MASLLSAMAPLKLSTAENVSSFESAASPRSMSCRNIRSRRPATYPYNAPLHIASARTANIRRFTRTDDIKAQGSGLRAQGSGLRLRAQGSQLRAQGAQGLSLEP